MAVTSLEEYLSSNAYPGRGIVLGKSEDNRFAVTAYFIMGRSENSRNRIFEQTEDGIRTRAFDESKMTDPSLIIYAPVRKRGHRLIVTNGDQTDTIAQYVETGCTFEEALRTRTFEPDAPNYTPRISGLVDLQSGDYRLSILKTVQGNPQATGRYFYEYTAVPATGHIIHTYQTDGDPLPSFQGEPVPVVVAGDIDAFTSRLWNSLNADNRVSLYVQYADLLTGDTAVRIVNAHQ